MRVFNPACDFAYFFCCVLLCDKNMDCFLYDPEKQAKKKTKTQTNKTHTPACIDLFFVMFLFLLAHETSNKTTWATIKLKCKQFPIFCFFVVFLRNFLLLLLSYGLGLGTWKSKNNKQTHKTTNIHKKKTKNIYYDTKNHQCIF